MGLNLTLNPNEVHIWRIDLTAGEAEIQHCHRLLSRDEIERAGRFYFDKHRRRFTVARAAMRYILSQYIRFSSQELSFSYGPKGRPRLSGPLMDSGIRFNLSHSHEIALLGVTHELDIGVDVELVDTAFGKTEVAERFFSIGEINTLRGLPSNARAEAFFSCWTRKEAYIKARGDGLSIPLDSFDVAFGPGVQATLLAVRPDPTEVKRWRIYAMDSIQGYKAAVVVAGKDHDLRHMDWKAEVLSSELSDLV